MAQKVYAVIGPLGVDPGIPAPTISVGGYLFDDAGNFVAYRSARTSDPADPNLQITFDDYKSRHDIERKLIPLLVWAFAHTDNPPFTITERDIVMPGWTTS